MTRRRVGRIVVRGEFGPLLGAALPECEIAALSGETHVTARVRDEAELYRLPRLGAHRAHECGQFGGLEPLSDDAVADLLGVVLTAKDQPDARPQHPVLEVEPKREDWIRSRPELDGRLLQPSDHETTEPDLVDVFPYTDRIVDLASVQLANGSDGPNALYVEISRPWPPNQANLLEPATWTLECWSAVTTSGPSAPP